MVVASPPLAGSSGRTTPFSVRSALVAWVPDDAAADHDHVAGHLLQLQRAGGVDDRLMVDLDAGQRRDAGASGDDDVLGTDLAIADLDAVGAGEGGVALQPLDLVLLEQELDAAGQPLDRLKTRAVHGVEVEFHLARLHAPFGERPVRRFLEKLGGVEQGLGRDAADIEAGAAQSLAALDAGGLEAELGRTDRGHIAARAGTDHQNVEVVFSHSHFPLSSFQRKLESPFSRKVRPQLSLG